MPLRCLKTGNPCGTDTVQDGFPCQCANCRPETRRRNEEAADAKYYGQMMDGCESDEERQAMHRYIYGT